MKTYGVTHSNGIPEVWSGNEAAGLARLAFNEEKRTMQPGEICALWSISETGFRSTLESYRAEELPN